MLNDCYSNHISLKFHHFIVSESGASRDPCSETYCGPKAFSESEVRGVADFLQKIPDMKAFIDFHSYSQLWMSPWGYTKDKPKDFEVQVRLMMKLSCVGAL